MNVFDLFEEHFVSCVGFGERFGFVRDHSLSITLFSHEHDFLLNIAENSFCSLLVTVEALSEDGMGLGDSFKTIIGFYCLGGVECPDLFVKIGLLLDKFLDDCDSLISCSDWA